MYVDSANNRVGIGTVSPATDLHLKGILTLEASDGDQATISVNTSDRIVFSGATRYYFGSRVAIYDSGNYAFFGAQNDDTVGTIIGNGSQSVIYVEPSTLGRRVGILDSSPDSILEIVSSGNNDLFMISSTSSADGDVFMIDSAGNVGIGTTTPGYLLDVAGILNASTISVAGAYTLPGADGSANQYLKTDGSGNLSWAAVSGGGTPEGTDGMIQYNNGGSFGGASQLFWDDGNNYLGLGVSTPDFPLEVLSTSTHQLALTYTDGTAFTSFYTDSSGNLTITPSGGDTTLFGGLNVDSGTFYIDRLNNRMGVGTLTPGSALEITTSTTGDAYFMISSSAGADGDIFKVDSSGNITMKDNAVIGSATEGDIYFFDGNNSGENYEVRIYGYITSTTGASYAAINLDDTNDELMIDINDGDGDTTLDAVFRLDDSSGLSMFRVRDSGGNDVFHVDSDGNLQIAGSTFAIDSIGRVAIGDSTPDAVLEIVTQGSGDYLYISSTAGGDGDIFTIDSSGNVGIGTTNPGGGTGSNILSIATASATPTLLGGTTHIYSNNGEGYWMDASGNITLQTPHDPATGEWIFLSENITSGKTLRVEMERMAKFIDEVFETSFVEEEFRIESSLNEEGAMPEDPVEEETVLSWFGQKIKDTLVSLGMIIEDGAATLKKVIADRFEAKVARIEKMEIVDSATGTIYCTWIENGVWKKSEGDCENADSSSAEDFFSPEENTEIINGEEYPAEDRHYCDEGYPELCITPEACQDAGLYWYDNDCHYEEEVKESEEAKNLEEESNIPQPEFLDEEKESILETVTPNN